MSIHFMPLFLFGGVSGSLGLAVFSTTRKKVPLTHRTPPHLGFSIVFSQSSHSKLDGFFYLETTKESINNG